jgi:dephospho-CoA kinase
MKLGITGGIGSGKTTVCRVFSILGIPVFYSDPEARIIMESNSAVIEDVNSAAGRNVYVNGKLDRTLLASLIFNDRELLGKINSIVHPLVFNKFTSWAEMQTAPYCILESAILFESEGWRHVDKSLVISAPAEERIMRVMRRNELSRSQVLERIRNQFDDSWRESKADYIIRNSEHDMIIKSVLTIHNEILKFLV